jgi:transposase
MYKQIEKVFEIYDVSTCKKIARKKLEQWFIQISKLDFITELMNTGRLIKNHFDRILNYFRHRLTN